MRIYYLYSVMLLARGAIPIEYVNASEAAEAWEISTQRVIQSASKGDIPGAIYVDGTWMIPINAQKPTDDTAAGNHCRNTNTAWRFPLFYLAHISEDRLAESYTDEEKELYNAHLLYEAGDLESSRYRLEGLLLHTDVTHVKIGVLFVLCHIYIRLENRNLFEGTYKTLRQITAEVLGEHDELSYFLWDVDILFKRFSDCLGEVHIPRGKHYNPLVSAYLTVMCAHSDAMRGFLYKTPCDPAVYEILCGQYEEKAFYSAAQMMHCFIGLMYGLSGNDEDRMFHYCEALRIAVEQNIYTPLAKVTGLFEDDFERILAKYPAEVAERFRKLGYKLEDSYLIRGMRLGTKNRFSDLDTRDYRYICYAGFGKTNKYIAQKEGFSEITIMKRYAALFNKLGVSNKAELVALYEKTLTDMRMQTQNTVIGTEMGN